MSNDGRRGRYSTGPKVAINELVVIGLLMALVVGCVGLEVHTFGGVQRGEPVSNLHMSQVR